MISIVIIRPNITIIPSAAATANIVITDVLVATAIIIAGILGGMNAPRGEAAVIVAAVKPFGYFLFHISGPIILEKAAAVAATAPVSSPKNAHPTTVTTASPPLTRPKMGSIASTIILVNPVFSKTTPINVKRKTPKRGNDLVGSTIALTATDKSIPERTIVIKLLNPIEIVTGTPRIISPNNKIKNIMATAASGSTT